MPLFFLYDFILLTGLQLLSQVDVVNDKYNFIFYRFGSHKMGSLYLVAVGFTGHHDFHPQ